MILQMLAGVDMELLHGKWNVFIIYFTASVSGSLLQLAVTPREYFIGASAAVFGIVFAGLVSAIQVRKRKFKRKLYNFIK